jgi:NADH dehydrogenase/NADH:ubiquinone oxidoreductase subunit G
VAGFNDLGTTGRGRSTEIGTYVEKMLSSELSGNLHDVCPVGALNNGPFAFTSRPYELLSKSSIDVMDGLGSHTITDYKDNVIMRVSPNVNEEINEEWLSDKSRHGFDGLKRQRLLRPLVRDGENFVENDWQSIFSLIRSKIDKVDGNQIAAGIGEFEDVESILALKDFLNSLNSFNYEFRRDANLHLDPTFRSNYLFNSRIQGIEDADAILLVGVNPRT